MYSWNEYARMTFALAEDVHAPELRNPRHSALRARGWLARLLGRA